MGEYKIELVVFLNDGIQKNYQYLPHRGLQVSKKICMAYFRFDFFRILKRREVQILMIQYQVSNFD